MVHVFSFVYGDFEADLRLLSKNNLLKVGLEKGVISTGYTRIVRIESPTHPRSRVPKMGEIPPFSAISSLKVAKPYMYIYVSIHGR